MKKSFSKLSDDQILDKTKEFKVKVEKGCSLDEILAEAFANVREAAKGLGQRHYDVQLIGGMVLNGGMISEMKTAK